LSDRCFYFPLSELLIAFAGVTVSSTSVIYAHSLHDALPISIRLCQDFTDMRRARGKWGQNFYIRYVKIFSPKNLLRKRISINYRSEEHTSELQSRENLVCRLLLEKNTK